MELMSDTVKITKLTTVSSLQVCISTELDTRTEPGADVVDEQCAEKCCVGILCKDPVGCGPVQNSGQLVWLCWTGR